MTIEPGCAGLIPPGVTLVYRYRGRAPHVYAHFSVGQVTEEDSRILIPVIQPLGDRFEPMARSLEEAVGWFATQPRRAAARLRDLLWQLGSTGDSAEAGHAERREIRQTLQLIERRLAEPLRVPAIAREIGLSHNHLLRLFREATGQTIAGYIRKRRAERARHLLQRTTMPINAIAASVGITDLQAFNKTIRREFGRAPRALRAATTDWS